MMTVITMSRMSADYSGDVTRTLAWRRSQVALLAGGLLLAGLVANPTSRSRAAEPDRPAARFLLAWGKQGSEPGEFHFPIGIAINQADEVLVTDHYNHRVQKFDTDGKLLAHFTVLPNPGGIALDKAGDIYLSHFPGSVLSKDINPDRVTVYIAAGELLHEWGKTGSGPGEFNYPGGMAVSQDGQLYVADQTNHRIQVLDLNGRFLATWGKHGTKPGEFGGNSNVKSRARGARFRRDRLTRQRLRDRSDGRSSAKVHGRRRLYSRVGRT